MGETCIYFAAEVLPLAHGELAAEARKCWSPTLACCPRRLEAEVREELVALGAVAIRDGQIVAALARFADLPGGAGTIVSPDVLRSLDKARCLYTGAAYCWTGETCDARVAERLKACGGSAADGLCAVRDLAATCRVGAWGSALEKRLLDGENVEELQDSLGPRVVDVGRHSATLSQVYAHLKKHGVPSPNDLPRVPVFAGLRTGKWPFFSHDPLGEMCLLAVLALKKGLPAGAFPAASKLQTLPLTLVYVHAHAPWADCPCFGEKRAAFGVQWTRDPARHRTPGLANARAVAVLFEIGAKSGVRFACTFGPPGPLAVTASFQAFLLSGESVEGLRTEGEGRTKTEAKRKAAHQMLLTLEESGAYGYG